MKPPSNNMGGGYRIKADLDALGRNSRLRYSYLPDDKRMMPYSNARLLANRNKKIGRTLQPDISTFTLVDWDVTEVETLAPGDNWDYRVNWTISNPSNAPLTYGVYAAYGFESGAIYFRSFGSSYTVSASSTKTETAQSINIDSVEGTTAVKIYFYNVATNANLVEYDAPTVHLYKFSNAQLTNQQLDNSTRGRLVYSAQFRDQISTNARPTTYLLFIYYKKSTESTYSQGHVLGFTHPNNGNLTTFNITANILGYPTNIEEGTYYDVKANVVFNNVYQTPRDYNRLGQDLYPIYTIEFPFITETTTVPALNDLIGINQLTYTAGVYPRILDQHTFYSSGGVDYDVTKAFNNTYQHSNQLRDWVASTNLLRLWAWIDLGQVRTVRRLRLWQQVNVPHQNNRVKNVKFYITDEASEASGEWSGNHTFAFDSATHRANSGLYYTNNSANFVTYDAVNDYDHIGKDSLDPTLPKNKSSTTGFWEFRFDNSNFPYMNRSGRYLYIRFDRRGSNAQPRIMQAQVIGY